MDKKLSICIPTYNRRKYLERSINALMPQLTDDIEVLISNNSSPDDTDEYCRTLDSRITYYKQPENIGADGNFLWLMENARGKYILILSDDDYLADGAVSRLLNFLDGKELGLAVINFRGKGVDNKLTHGEGEDLEFGEERLSEFLEFVGVHLTFISSLIFNRDLLHKVSDKNQYNKTNLLQTCVALKCLELNKNTAVIRSVECVAENGNSSGYNIYKVFVKNWHDVLFKVGLSAGLPKKTLNKIFDKTLGTLVLGSMIEDKLGYSPFETDHKFKYLKCAFRFKKAWTKIYPTALMPRSVVKLVLKLKKIEFVNLYAEN